MRCDARHITLSAGTPFGVLPDTRERQQCASAITQSFGKGRGGLAPANEVMGYSRRTRIRRGPVAARTDGYFPAHLRSDAAEKTFISQHHKMAICPGPDAEPDSMHSGTDICVATVAPWIPADQE